MMKIKMVTEGIEPSTVALLAQRSNQLSYATFQICSFYFPNYLTSFSILRQTLCKEKIDTIVSLVRLQSTYEINLETGSRWVQTSIEWYAIC